jgi:hypothetical protein
MLEDEVICDVSRARELPVHNPEDDRVMGQHPCVAASPDLVAMRARMALAAWGRRDAFDERAEARIPRFFRAYRGIDHHKG